MIKLLILYKENPRQGQLLLFLLVGFLIIYFLPVNTERFSNAWLESIRLTNWYAKEHVILCLLPAFAIAGAMAVYITQGSVMRYLGPKASKPIALSVASVSGALLAVCSCTVLPLFGGIYRRGAGLGAFMYFSTLTEVPIVQGLLGAGMGKGPALALLLEGSALSLPNMLVIRTIIGTQKTLVYCALVVMALFVEIKKENNVKFTIYGSGCSKCQQLTANTEAAAKASNIRYEIEKITNTKSIIDAGIMRTPAPAIDDKIVIGGKVASIDEIKQLFV
jgi:small redox-active disulfide protein 2